MASLIRKLIPETRTIDGIRYKVVREPSVAPGARAVQIEEFEGESVDSLDFLEPARESLTHLIVTNLSIRDVSVVSQLDALQSLTLHVGKIRRGVDTTLPALEHLVTDWSTTIAPLLSCPRLRELTIVSPPADLPLDGGELDSLTLKNVKKVRLPSIRLRKLEVAGGRRRGEIAGLANVAGLKDLTLDSVAPTDLPTTPTAGFATLELLVLEECGNFPSVTAFASADLTELIVIGNVSVQDGSLVNLSARRRRFPPGFR